MRWCALDMGFLLWREFYGAARLDPKAAIAGALREAAAHAGRFGTPLYLFDKGPYARSALFPGYKAGRDSGDDEERAAAKADFRLRLPAVAQALRDSGRFVMCYAGYEADDHAGAVAQALPKGHTLTIVSRDKDLLQLVRPRVSLFDPVTGAAHTPATFRADWPGLHPSRWAEVKAIAGCDTDAVPGVKGVGEKTAAKYLTGGLLPLHAARAKIEAFVGGPDYHRNLALCSLPFPGTPPVVLE